MMDDRRKLALLMAAAFCSLAVALPALMPTRASVDPLAPLEHSARLGLVPMRAPDEAMLAPLRHQAHAALRQLQAMPDPER